MGTRAFLGNLGMVNPQCISPLEEEWKAIRGYQFHSQQFVDPLGWLTNIVVLFPTVLT